jgi:hypothetical protein
MFRIRRAWMLLTLVVFLPAGCPPLSNWTADGIWTPTDGGGAAGPSGNNGSAGNNGPATGECLMLSGRLNPGQTTKPRLRMQATDPTYSFTIVAQSDQTGSVYITETQPDGEFALPLPPEEADNSFVVTILGPDGRAVGPVVFDTDATGTLGVTGLTMQRDADLGTIDLPDDPTTAAITPGPDGNAVELADPAIAARLNEDGAPLGLKTVGKGATTLTASPRTGGVADADEDGLVDVFDADDDGDGVIDDLDKGDEWTGVPDDIHVNFFMNLKIQASEAQTYYTGSAEEIAAALSEQTVITLEVMSEPGATRAITGAHLRETPGPVYLPIATVLNSGGSGWPVLWKDLGYAFAEKADRFDAFIVPHAVMDAGDTFTLEVTFDDGSSVRVSRMINYVFKNIPALVEYGTPTAVTAFDITDPTANGTQQAPLKFDGSQDLVLVFRPPPDETGTPITGTDYSFGIFFNGTDGSQLNSQIDKEATWPAPVSDWTTYQGLSFRVTADDLGELSEDGTYRVKLPREIFVDQVVLTDGSTADVASYKIDITAEVPTGNAALMLMFVKE